MEFIVRRTQELLYYIREIKQNNLMPEYPSFRVYVDSPLANEATAVFLQCNEECLDQDTLDIMSSGRNPIWFDGLETTVSAEESKALNTDPAPKVIIASGGMCEGGLIRHHLKHHLWDARNTIMFAGYQAAGTLGRIIYDGAKSVKIFGEQIDVNAEITLLAGMSGHADQAGLMNWLAGFTSKPSYVFVNHGDDESCTGFAELVTERFGIPAMAPYSGSEFDLLAGEWIRLTDAEYRKKEQAAADRGQASPKKTKQEVFRNLSAAVADLNEYAMSLAEHSNDEIVTLTKKIRQLLNGRE